MKGLIASLLALMMTGMVFSQQPQSSRFGSSDIGASNSNRLLKKYLLVMDDNLIRGLKTQGQLKSYIDADQQQTIDHVVFHSSDANSARTDLQPRSIIQTGAIDGNGKLEFMMNDRQIQQMRETGLQYIIPFEDRGKYREIVVTYESDQRFPPLTNSTTRFDNSDRNNGFVGQDRRNEPFIGPLLPEELANRNTVGNDLQNRDFRTQDNVVANTQPLRVEDFQSDLERRRQLERERERELARSQQLNQNQFPRTGEIGQGNDWNRNQAVNLNNEFRDRNFGNQIDDDRIRMDAQRRAEDRLLAERRLSQREQQLSSLENERLAEQNKKLKRMLEDERLIRGQKERELDWERRVAIAESRDRVRRQFDEERSPYDDARFDDGYERTRYANRRPEDYGDRVVIEDTRSRDQYVNMPTRQALVPTPTNKPPTLEIGGPGKILDPNDPATRTNQALWFIMLCSVGLNFYLSWIARGFYVRYEELADEIRDTFTTSTM